MSWANFGWRISIACTIAGGIAVSQYQLADARARLEKLEVKMEAINRLNIGDASQAMLNRIQHCELTMEALDKSGTHNSQIRMSSLEGDIKHTEQEVARLKVLADALPDIKADLRSMREAISDMKDYMQKKLGPVP